MLNVVGKAHSANQYVFIHDKQGSVATFFQYKKMVFDYGPQHIKTELGNQTADDTLEALRSKLVYAWRSGNTLGINIDKTVPNFN